MPKARSLQERKAQIAASIDPSMEAFTAAQKYADDLAALDASTDDSVQIVTARRSSRAAPSAQTGSRVGGFNPGAVFDSASEAAFAAHQTYNPKSISENLEHLWVYFQDTTTGKYGYSDPVYSGLEGVSRFPLKPTLNGDPVRTASLIGMGHNHGNYSDRNGAPTIKARDIYGSDRFSREDQDYMRARPHDMTYFTLGTPSGKFVEQNSAARAKTLLPSLPDLLPQPAPLPPLSMTIPSIDHWE